MFNNSIHFKNISLQQKIQKSPYLLTLLKGTGVFVKDYISGEVIPNTLWKNLGYTERDMKHDNWLQFIHPDDLEKAQQFHKCLISGERDLWEGEYRIQARSGEYLTLRHRALVLERSEDKTPRIYVGWDIDITDLVKELEATKKQLEEYKNLLQRSEDIRNATSILSTTLDPYEAAEHMIDQAKRILSFDAAAVRVLEDDTAILLAASGFSSEYEPAGLPNFFLHPTQTTTHIPQIINPTSGPYRTIMTVPILRKNKLVGALELYSKKVSFSPKEVGDAMLFSEQAGVAFTNALRYKVSEQEAATDWLTGLPTRRSFYAKLNRILLEVKPDEILSVLIIDIDHFKYINDNYGHIFGDSVLVGVASACKEVFRTQDISCRYGGEEFLILLHGADQKTSKMVAERIREHVQNLTFSEHPEVSVSVSIGIYTTTFQQDIQESIACADEALYRAKESGRNRCILYN